MTTSVMTQADAYKLSHHKQYPEWVNFVYSNLTPRKDRSGVGSVVFFGLQAFLDELEEKFGAFFASAEDDAVNQFSTEYYEFFGARDELLVDRVRELHQYGRIPIKVMALPEGTVSRHGVPMLTIQNTHPKFFWFTNFIETWMSNALWTPITSATTALAYRRVFDEYADKTSDITFLPEYQGHDFSMRGMVGTGAAQLSGAGHLASFKGTDTLPAVSFVKKHYPFDGMNEPGAVGTSIPATEHSVMCAGGQDSELDTFSRLLDVYPSGMLSVVSDTWDFWSVVDEILPALKDKIMARDGKVVIRPDSSPKTPVEIICGDPESEDESERKGLVERLYEVFGGEVNSKGYKQLDPHIGAIYGDSITLEYQKQILSRLEEKGFASTNIVLGIGSYTYQYVTRDTHGIAIKATAVGSGEWENGWPHSITPISKDPKTDNSGKKSASGLLAVYQGGLVQNASIEQVESGGNDMRLVYNEGFVIREGFDVVRNRLKGAL